VKLRIEAKYIAMLTFRKRPIEKTVQNDPPHLKVTTPKTLNQGLTQIWQEMASGTTKQNILQNLFLDATGQSLSMQHRQLIAKTRLILIHHAKLPIRLFPYTYCTFLRHPIAAGRLTQNR
jgi:hypothetical protein